MYAIIIRWISVPLFMGFTNKRGFFKAGSVAVVLGIVLNYIGMTSFLHKTFDISSFYTSGIFLTNTLYTVSVGLIMFGLIIIFVGLVREN
jgi:hypothetical protein